MNTEAVNPNDQQMPHRPALEHYVDANVVARHLSITRRHVLELTRAKQLPAYAVDPEASRKTWRYKLSEVDRTIARGTKKQAAATPNNGLGFGQNPSDNDRHSPRSRKEQSDG